MKRYDLSCPVCGTVNHGLDLEETDGLWECAKCETLVHQAFLDKTSLPVCVSYQSKDMKKIVNPTHAA